MSRAFVKENDLEYVGINIPERPISNFKNYVTQFGLKQLKEQLHNLEKELKEIKNSDISSSIEKKFRIERDILYYKARIKSAILVDLKSQDKNKVLFSASVEVFDENGNNYIFKIVGEDEAGTAENKINYTLPLSKALLGKKVGDQVEWIKPNGDIGITIKKIYYD